MVTRTTIFTVSKIDDIGYEVDEFLDDEDELISLQLIDTRIITDHDYLSQSKEYDFLLIYRY
jgi:hypothetical protein